MNYFLAFILAVLAQVAAANPLIDALRADDELRICSAGDASPEAKVLISDAKELMTAMNVPADTFAVLVADCGRFAVTAMTYNVIVLPPRLAHFAKNERLFVLAHEIGHLANKDLTHWTEVGDELVRAPLADDLAANRIYSVSRALELDADRFAARTLSKLGVDAVSAATDVFTRLHVLDAQDDDSHPAPKLRVEFLAQAMAPAHLARN